MIDVKKVQATAKKEVAEETEKQVVEKLKALYRTREKAVLALKNIDREIDNYLSDAEELAVYNSAGVEKDADK